MPKRIPRLLLDFTPLATPGGARGIGRYIRELAGGLFALPSEELEGIELIGLTSLSYTGQATVTRDFESFLNSRGPTLFGPRDYYRWAYRQRFALWLAAKRLGVDAVHITDPHGTPRLFGIAGTKRIVTCHDLVPTRFPNRYFGARDGGARLGQYIERQRFRSADLVIAVSEATRIDVCSLLGVPESRVVRVYEGVDLDKWAAEPTSDAKASLKRLGLLGQAFALYVGGSDWRKNVEGMLAAVAHVRALGLDLKLAWAGHLEPQHLAHVAAVAKDTGMSEAYCYLGFVPDEDLSVLYRAAAAHLLVSRLEGFGLTLVEAMASGCPVVTTRAGSLFEITGNAAITVDPEDVLSIAAALERLMREPELRNELIARGRARARVFSRGEQARAMAKVYRRFLLPET